MIELLKHLSEYRRDAVLTPVLVALEAVGELFLTLTIGRFIDELSASGTGMDTIWAYGLRLLLFALLCLVLGTVAGLSSTRAAAGLSRNLRDGMFSRIQDISFANIDKFSTNSLVTRVRRHARDGRHERAERRHDDTARGRKGAHLHRLRPHHGFCDELADRAPLPGRHSRPLLLSHGHRPRDAPHIPPRLHKGGDDHRLQPLPDADGHLHLPHPHRLAGCQGHCRLLERDCSRRHTHDDRRAAEPHNLFHDDTTG